MTFFKESFCYIFISSVSIYSFRRMGCNCNQQTQVTVIVLLDTIFLGWIVWWYTRAFGLGQNVIILISVVMVSCIISATISIVLAIKNNQYKLLPFMIGKCVIVGVTIAYGMGFFLALGKIRCDTWHENWNLCKPVMFVQLWVFLWRYCKGHSWTTVIFLQPWLCVIIFTMNMYTSKGIQDVTWKFCWPSVVLDDVMIDLKHG